HPHAKKMDPRVKPAGDGWSNLIETRSRWRFRSTRRRPPHLREHLGRCRHLGETVGAALEAQFGAAPELHVPVLAHMRGSPGGVEPDIAPSERERDQRRAR